MFLFILACTCIYVLFCLSQIYMIYMAIKFELNWIELLKVVSFTKFTGKKAGMLYDSMPSICTKRKHVSCILRSAPMITAGDLSVINTMFEYINQSAKIHISWMTNFIIIKEFGYFIRRLHRNIGNTVRKESKQLNPFRRLYLSKNYQGKL